MDPAYGAMSMPIYQTSNFVFDDIGKTRAGYDYSRTANPTRKVLEDTLAKLEGGHAGFAFGTGMAANNDGSSPAQNRRSCYLRR